MFCVLTSDHLNLFVYIKQPSLFCAIIQYHVLHYVHLYALSVLQMFLNCLLYLHFTSHVLIRAVVVGCPSMCINGWFSSWIGSKVFGVK